VNHQTAGIHIKSPPGRGGIITNITYRNIVMNNVRQCILVGVGGSGCNETALPRASNILFENVRLSPAALRSIPAVRQALLLDIVVPAPVVHLNPYGCGSRACCSQVRCNEGSTSSYDIMGSNKSFPIENMRFVNVTMGAAVKKEANCRFIDCTCDALTSPCPSCCKKA
jgi:polygalacturonase